LDAAGVRHDRKGWLFRAVNRRRRLTDRRLSETDVLPMIKRRSDAGGVPDGTCCHTFRATGITAYLENGGTLENAQQIACHESPRTTKLYDRSNDTLTLDESSASRAHHAVISPSLDASGAQPPNVA
jgi:integrase